MRDKKNRPAERQPSRKNIATSKTSNKRGKTPGTGLIGEHDLGDAAERTVDRNIHTKSSVTGSDADGQTE
jgi:hypothetical protein